MDAVLLADLLRRQFRGRGPNRVDFLLDLGQGRSLLQEPHAHVQAALDVEFLVERVEIVPHGFVAVRPLHRLLVRHVGTPHAGDLLHVGEDLDAAFAQDLLGDASGGDDGGGVPAAEEPGADGVVVRPYLMKLA